MKDASIIWLVALACVAPISGGIGFVAGTHFYANSDFTTKRYIHFAAKAVDPILRAHPGITPYTPHQGNRWIQEGN